MKHFLFLFFLSFSARAQEMLPWISPDVAGDVYDVQMNHYLVASKTEMSRVKSTGVGPCVVITLYDPVTKVGAIGHFSATTDIPLIMNKIFSEMRARGVMTNGVVARVGGGFKNWPQSKGTADRVEKELKKNKIKILAREPLVENPLPQNGIGELKTSEVITERSYLFDLGTGQMFVYPSKLGQTSPKENGISSSKSSRK
jgi:chemotaxis receptor (MCP) glutamine deamidase CheD